MRRRLCAVGTLRSKLQGLLERRPIGGSKSIADQTWCERDEPSLTEPSAGVIIAELGCKLLEGVLTLLAPDRIRLKTMTVQDRLK